MSLKIIKKTSIALLIGATGMTGLLASAPSYAYGHYHHERYHHHGDAVAAGFLGAAVGLVAGAAIAESYGSRDYYYREHYRSKRCYYDGYRGHRVCVVTQGYY